MDIRTFYVWSKNEEIRLGNETVDIVESLINSFLSNYQKEQKVSREKSDLVFDSVDLVQYKFHKASLKRGNEYINSPEWIANKKATINPENTKCNCCFAYSLIVALNNQNIKNHPERIVNIIPFVDQYDWESIDFPAGIKDSRKFEKNHESIALNTLQVPHDEKNICHVCKSKYNHTRKNQVVLSMINDSEKWRYTALKSEQTENGLIRPKKSLSRLFRGITSNHKEDFYCLNCLHSFRSNNILKKHEKLFENNDYSYIEMPTKKNNTLKNH